MTLRERASILLATVALAIVGCGGSSSNESSGSSAPSESTSTSSEETPSVPEPAELLITDAGSPVSSSSPEYDTSTFPVIMPGVQDNPDIVVLKSWDNVFRVNFLFPTTAEPGRYQVDHEAIYAEINDAGVATEIGYIRHGDWDESDSSDEIREFETHVWRLEERTDEGVHITGQWRKEQYSPSRGALISGGLHVGDYDYYVEFSAIDPDGGQLADFQVINRAVLATTGHEPVTAGFISGLSDSFDRAVETFLDPFEVYGPLWVYKEAGERIGKRFEEAFRSGERLVDIARDAADRARTYPNFVHGEQSRYLTDRSFDPINNASTFEKFMQEARAAAIDFPPIARLLDREDSAQETEGGFIAATDETVHDDGSRTRRQGVRPDKRTWGHRTSTSISSNRIATGGPDWLPEGCSEEAFIHDYPQCVDEPGPYDPDHPDNIGSDDGSGGSGTGSDDDSEWGDRECTLGIMTIDCAALE